MLKKQSGLTLVELMIGMLVGIIVAGGAVSIFSNSVSSQSDNIKLTRLNQDLRAMMDIMVRDIRRAGFVTSLPDTHFASLQDNPFFDTTTDISILDYDGGTDNCIMYSYNRDENDDDGGGTLESPPAVDNNERLGFRLASDNQLEMRQTGTTNASCGGSWQTITEPEVEITNLQFTLTSSPLNVTSMMNDDDNDGVVEASDSDGVPYGDDNSNGLCDTGEVCNTCVLSSPPASGDLACLFVRHVTISLAGRLTDDNAVTQTITQDVRIRNDKFIAAVP